MTVMPFDRVLRLCKRAQNTTDIRKARRSFNVALRWTDRNRSDGWDIAEYHAMRRASVRHNYALTARYLTNARAKAKRISES